jgi:hypothetical protein
MHWQNLLRGRSKVNRRISVFSKRTVFRTRTDYVCNFFEDIQSIPGGYPFDKGTCQGWMLWRGASSKGILRLDDHIFRSAFVYITLFETNFWLSKRIMTNPYRLCRFMLAKTYRISGIPRGSRLSRKHTFSYSYTI